MLEAMIPVSRWLHFVGFSLAVGSAAAVTIARNKSRQSGPTDRPLLDGVVISLMGGELFGFIVALIGGVLIAVFNPTVIDPKVSGPWFMVKMALVLAAFVLAFVRSVDAKRIVREREQGAKEAELEPLRNRGFMLDRIMLFAELGIIFITVFRFVLFA